MGGLEARVLPKVGDRGRGTVVVVRFAWLQHPIFMSIVEGMARLSIYDLQRDDKSRALNPS